MYEILQIKALETNANSSDESDDLPRIYALHR